MTEVWYDTATAPLPPQTCLSINRCNLPARVLAGLGYQHHPTPIRIDGVRELHHQLFEVLESEPEPGHRAAHFANHLRACFQLGAPDALGYDANSRRPGRIRADYRQLLRGWLFNPDGREAAVIKGWVESRFGLQTRYHLGPLPDRDSDAYQRYLGELAAALYNTSGLYDQLDLLYSYCQYELARQDRGFHRQLYRGVQRLSDLEVIATPEPRRPILLLNNINSFSGCRERADEFGNDVITAQVPTSKLLYVPGLIPGVLRGEQEHLVIGGLYQVELISP